MQLTEERADVRVIEIGRPQLGPAAADVRVTSFFDASRAPSLAWTGSEYGVAWSDFRDGDGDVYFARLSSGGLKLGAERRVTDAAAVLASMIWVSKSRRSELEAWSGAVVRLGRSAGVATPVHAFIYSSLLPAELRARGEL